MDVPCLTPGGLGFHQIDGGSFGRFERRPRRRGAAPRIVHFSGGSFGADPCQAPLEVVGVVQPKVRGGGDAVRRECSGQPRASEIGHVAGPEKPKLRGQFQQPQIAGRCGDQSLERGVRAQVPAVLLGIVGGAERQAGERLFAPHPHLQVGVREQVAGEEGDHPLVVALGRRGIERPALDLAHADLRQDEHAREIDRPRRRARFGSRQGDRAREVAPRGRQPAGGGVS